MKCNKVNAITIYQVFEEVGNHIRYIIIIIIIIKY